MRILIVEDEPTLRDQLVQAVAAAGHTVESASDGAQAHYLGEVEDFDAVVLDLGLPVLDGLSVLRRWRAAGRNMPVLILTARGAWHEKVTGMDAGADDYLAKPFELAELLARVRSALRRRSWEARDTLSETGRGVLRFGEAYVNFDTHEATAFGKPVRLTQLELDLLYYFSRHPNRVLTREHLLEHVWKLRNAPNTRSVDNFIVRLRKYFEPQPDKPIYFVSHRGAGYKFIPEGRAESA